MSSNPNIVYGSKPINEAVESLNVQQLEREADAVAPFANVHVELTRAIKDADLRIHTGNRQRGGDNTFDGVDGAYDLVRLAENAMQEARHEPRHLKPYEAIFIEHMQVVADAYKKYSQLDPGTRETLGAPNSPNTQYFRSNDLEGGVAHDYIIQAEYAATHPYDTDAAQAANEADQLLNNATGYYQNVNRFYQELLDEVADESKEVSVDNAANETDADELDIDEDDLFAAMQHDFKDFTPSAEMQASEDFGGSMTERGRELLVKDRKADIGNQQDVANSETTSEGQEWFDAMNESFNAANQDKSVEVQGAPSTVSSEGDDMIEALREMGLLDESVDSEPEVDVARQAEASVSESSSESAISADEVPESLEQAKLDKRRKKAAKALGKLTKSVMFSADKNELRRATKKMKKLSRKLG